MVDRLHGKVLPPQILLAILDLVLRNYDTFKARFSITTAVPTNRLSVILEVYDHLEQHAFKKITHVAMAYAVGFTKYQ